MNEYTQEDYAIAYAELIEILKNIPDEELQKIPIEKIEEYESKKDRNHNFKYNLFLDFEEQKLSHLTYILLAQLYTKYWASEAEREKIEKYDSNEISKIEAQKSLQYSTDNLFKNKEKEIAVNEESKELIVVQKRNIFEKVILKIKKLMHIK